MKIKSRDRGSFVIKFGNNKKISFRTREAYSDAFKVISSGTFRNSGEMHARVKQCPSGFEYIALEKKAKELVKEFNAIEFDD